jgi:hypothetical protein
VSKYLYQVVSGAALFGKVSKALWAARGKAELLAASAAGAHGPFEIERILELPGGGRRYWRLRGKRWTTDWHAPIEERKPAWSAPALDAASRQGRFVDQPCSPSVPNASR